MKPNTTPRTLAECHFVSGYPIAQLRREGAAADFAVALICAAVVGALCALALFL